MASKPSTIRLCFFYFMLFSFMHFSSCTVLSFTSHVSTCNGTIADCNQEEELLMESEISRRFLEQKRYISDGALQRDKPVCNGGGSGEAYSKSGGCLPPPQILIIEAALSTTVVGLTLDCISMHRILKVVLG